MAVFNDNPPGKKRRLRLGYSSGAKARASVKKLRKQPRQYQVQAAHTLYYRAKYHRHQTEGMKNAMSVYGKFLKTLKHRRHNKTHKRT